METEETRGTEEDQVAPGGTEENQGLGPGWAAERNIPFPLAYMHWRFSRAHFGF